MKLKPLISSESVDAVFINDRYQDEHKPLVLSNSDVQCHQYNIEF